MLERLKTTEKRYMQINEELMSPDIVKDIKRMTELSKEQRSLEATVVLYREYVSVLEEIESLKENRLQMMFDHSNKKLHTLVLII